MKKKQSISPEFKKWLTKTGKKYAEAFKVLASEDPKELAKYDNQVTKISTWFKQFYKEDKKLLNELVKR